MRGCRGGICEAGVDTISVLRDIECGFEPVDPAAMIQRTAASLFDGGRQIDRRHA
jgi:hypothetical protein